MKTLVLGASGYIGQRLMLAMKATSWVVPVGTSRSRPALSAAEPGSIRVDTLDAKALAAALQGFDAVVNCVAGDARSISEGARVLAGAANAASCPRIIHLSSMSVYGPVEGLVTESTRLDPGLGWYGRAKCDAEAHMAEFVRRGGQAVVLRPGCVFGPGSELWVGRIGRWLRTGRIGDLGVGGDGWSNLVNVDDVCQAILAALQLPVGAGKLPSFNLAAPDSPRWNDYFVDLAIALGATPVKRIGSSRLRLDSFIAGPPLKVAQRAMKYAGIAAALPDPIPPGLIRLWAQHIKLDAAVASRELGVRWTPYDASMQSCVNWLTGKDTTGAHNLSKAICTP
jgi:nucleoside-diphosphate-sugar epimerase